MSARNGRRLQQALIYLVLIVASVDPGGAGALDGFGLVHDQRRCDRLAGASASAHLAISELCRFLYRRGTAGPVLRQQPLRHLDGGAAKRLLLLRSVGTAWPSSATRARI